MEEAGKEQALKQVAESSLSEKVIELATVEQRAASTERARGLAEQKAEALQGKLGETETKLAQVKSIVLALDKELVDLKETMKRCEQEFYNTGFIDAENFYCKVIFKAQRLGFTKGQMAIVNVINLLKTFSFRDPS